MYVCILCNLSCALLVAGKSTTFDNLSANVLIASLTLNKLHLPLPSTAGLHPQTRQYTSGVIIVTRVFLSFDVFKMHHVSAVGCTFSVN